MRVLWFILISLGVVLNAQHVYAASALESKCLSLKGRKITFNNDLAIIKTAVFNDENTEISIAKNTMGQGNIKLPAHCEITAVMHERIGNFGQKYSINIHMRLPEKWNERMVYQGGGGSNGEIGDALGHVSSSGPLAAAMGYAVISQDSGHDNNINNDPMHNGTLSFGFDPQARKDYGRTSLIVTANAANAIIKNYYGKKPLYKYFVGCSKGGQEGMAFAQYYPKEFNGIIATAPGFSLPRAALAEAWDIQSFAPLVANSNGNISFMDLYKSYSDEDLNLVQGAILKACDADDGLEDGIISAFNQCTNQKVIPQLNEIKCKGEKSQTCLSDAQIKSLIRVINGVKNSHNESLYSSWFWPSSINDKGWRIWKIGSSDGRIPALNLVLGAPSLASVFTVPPTPLGDPQSMLNYQMAFDFDRDANKIYATSKYFKTSAWEDVNARSGNLIKFQKNGGKMIVPHGVSDPVFSLQDTLNWFEEVNQTTSGKAKDFIRVFPVPGMCHCEGGQATDKYDMFTALTNWVENGKAPNSVIATAGGNTPWPERKRLLCAYPETAFYKGGDIEEASSFECRTK